MIKKVNNFYDKHEEIIETLLTIIFFTLLSLLILDTFSRINVLKNILLNTILLTTIYVSLILLFIIIIYKTIKFIYFKPKITDKKFRKLWEKRYELAKRISKEKENSKKYNQLMKDINTLAKEIDKSSIKFKNELVFFAFSIYFGLLEGFPIWSAKYSIKSIIKSLKYTFKPYNLEFKWYKLKEGIYRIDSSIRIE